MRVFAGIDREMLERYRLLMAEYGISLRREVGQHLLLNPEALDLMADSAGVRGSDAVLEVGPGPGNLTERIVEKRPKSLTLVERDRRFVRLLEERFGGLEWVEVIRGSALRVLPDEAHSVMVSNPPYGISSRLVVGLSLSGFERVVLTFQQEFGRRLTASPGTPAYGSLSVLTQVRYDVAPLALLRASCFYPRPRVDTVMLLLRSRSPPGPELRMLKGVLPHIFSRRKRTLRAALKGWLRGVLGLEEPRLSEVLDQCPISTDERVYKVSPDEYLALASFLKVVSDEVAGGRGRGAADQDP